MTLILQRAEYSTYPPGGLATYLIVKDPPKTFTFLSSGADLISTTHTPTEIYHDSRNSYSGLACPASSSGRQKCPRAPGTRHPNLAAERD